MKSPFPGVDPYLQRRWGDFHNRFLTYLSDEINDRLPRNLLARSQETVTVEESERPPRRYLPDAHAYETPTPAAGFQHEGGGTAMALDDPIVLMSPLKLKQSSIQIIDSKSDGAVVTAIELLSPSNKVRSPAREKYLAKQDDYLAAGVNLLELDWIRRGSPATFATRFGISDKLKSTYHASMVNFTRGGRLEYYRIPYDARLPRLALPLRSKEEFVPLDLQPVFDYAYERGRYADELTYEGPPTPPFRGKAAKWAADRIAAWRAEHAG